MPVFSHSDYLAILLSVRMAVAATLLSLPFGFAVAHMMTYKRFRGRVALDVIVNSYEHLEATEAGLMKLPAASSRVSKETAFLKEPRLTL